MAKKRQTVGEMITEALRRHEEEEQRQRVMVITEFDAGGDPQATMQAMAAEILRVRLCLRQLADAIELTRAGSGFGLLYPGPARRPQRTPEAPGSALSAGVG